MTAPVLQSSARLSLPAEVVYHGETPFRLLCMLQSHSSKHRCATRKMSGGEVTANNQAAERSSPSHVSEPIRARVAALHASTRQRLFSNAVSFTPRPGVDSVAPGYKLCQVHGVCRGVTRQAPCTSNQ